MLVGALALFAPALVSLAEPSVLPRGRAIAHENAQVALFRVVRFFEESSERSGLAAGATLELLDLPRSHQNRKRLWRNVPGSGVVFDSRVLRMTIAKMSVGRATVDAKTRSTVLYHHVDGSQRAEKPQILSDRIELVQKGSEWLITSVARRIR